MNAPYCPEKGDFIWIDFEPQSGREIMKRRPAIVLTERSYNQQQGLCVVCPSSTKQKRYMYEVPAIIEMEKPSLIKVDQIRSLDWRTRRAKFIGKAPADVMEEVTETIAALLMIA
jgi:mRNA interferase MazF